MAAEGMRLDATAYITGGLEARDKIHARTDWKPLGKVTNCLFNGPRFPRRYVLDPKRGTPFLSSSDILLADLTSVPLLSKKGTPEMQRLLVEGGWTLISCSGTIGNTAYVRGEMAGMAASQHVMRAVADPSEIKSGYLFAFLSGRLAQAMIAQRTYGSVIQHIEPHHIADLPVPLPDEDFQKRIHSLVESAASKRTEASKLIRAAAQHFDSLIERMPSMHHHARAVSTVRATELAGRLDAFYHVGWAAESNLHYGDRIDSLGDVIVGNREPRIFVQRGVPFLSGIDIFRTRPTVRVRLAKWIADRPEVRVKTGDLVVQSAGQRYGLIGNVALIGQRLHDWAGSQDLIRIRTSEADNRARIFAFLCSDVGHRAILRHSYGTSIPHINSHGVRAVQIPALPKDLVSGAARALTLREEADKEEETAIEEVEAWLS